MFEDKQFSKSIFSRKSLYRVLLENLTKYNVSLLSTVFPTDKFYNLAFMRQMIPSLQKLLKDHLEDCVSILRRGFLSEETVSRLDNWCFFEKATPIIQAEIG